MAVISQQANGPRRILSFFIVILFAQTAQNVNSLNEPEKVRSDMINLTLKCIFCQGRIDSSENSIAFLKPVNQILKKIHPFFSFHPK